MALLASFVFCVIAVSSQSFWIDEAGTATIAMKPTLAGWWGAMERDGGSSTQMPLYMIYVWVWEKFFGHSEWALRAANLPWLLAGLFALPRKKNCLMIAVIVSPFVWYYLNEARPYVMQIAASIMIFGALWHLVEPESTPTAEKKWSWIFGFGIFVICGSSLLGVIWAGAAVAVMVPLLGWKSALSFARRHALLILATVIILALLGAYYFWTLKRGNRASDVATTDWKNAVFIAYELFGFAGLGPGRLEIRSEGLNVFWPYLPQLTLFASLILCLLVSAGLFLKKTGCTKKILWMAVIVLAPVIFLFAIGCVLHFRVLGRHFAPLFAVTTFLIALGATNLWRKNVVGKIIVIGFFGLCLTSDFSLRFQPRHAKDDYRSAAAMAKVALSQGKIVWWNADIVSAEFYQLPLTTNFVAASRALLVINPPESSLPGAVPPQLVICSRPDIYDPHGTLAKFVEGKNFTRDDDLQAFTIWKKE